MGQYTVVMLIWYNVTDTCIFLWAQPIIVLLSVRMPIICIMHNILWTLILVKRPEKEEKNCVYSSLMFLDFSWTETVKAVLLISAMTTEAVSL